MNTRPTEIVYRPDPDAHAARILADLERLAATHAELPGHLIQGLLTDPALPLTDLTALRTITCTDATPFPADAGARLGVSIEPHQTPAMSPQHIGAAPHVDLERLRTGAQRAADAEMKGVDFAAVLQAAHDLDRAALLTMLHALQIPLEGIPRADVICRAVPEYRALMQRWLDALVNHDLIEYDGPGEASRVRAKRTVTAADTTAAWNRVEVSWRRGVSPTAAADSTASADLGSPTLAYARATANKLPELMRGTVSPMSLLFPDGSIDVARALYREPPVARYQLAAVAGFVAELIAAVPSGHTLRFLEVGGGTGATTERVLAAIGNHSVNYLFTDLSDYFLTAAQNQFGANASSPVSFRIGKYDIDASDDQGTGTGFDVILAGGVLNNARNTEHSLRLLATQLAPGGWLLITEPTQEVQWIAMSQAFMMTAADDERQQSGETFLTYQQWQTAFERTSGLDLVLDLPPHDHLLSQAGHRFFALQKSRPPQTGRVST